MLPIDSDDRSPGAAQLVTTVHLVICLRSQVSYLQVSANAADTCLSKHLQVPAEATVPTIAGLPSSLQNIIDKSGGRASQLLKRVLAISSSQWRLPLEATIAQSSAQMDLPL
jgi:hypothetical protein